MNTWVSPEANNKAKAANWQFAIFRNTSSAIVEIFRSDILFVWSHMMKVSIFGKIIAFARIISLFFLAVGTMTAMVGCVSVGSEEMDIFYHYQRFTSNYGSQLRLGDQGLDLLRPVARQDLPKLKIVPNSQTSVSVVYLRLDEALIRGLINSLDIQVASFEPAMSHEEMIKAAAEFDFTVFGSYGYNKDKKRTSDFLEKSEIKERAYEAGIKQKLITGAEWSLRWSNTRKWDNDITNRFKTSYEPTLMLRITQPLLRDGWPGVNLATLRISQRNHQANLSAFRQKVEEVITEIMSTYWGLVQARQEVEILQALLDETTKTLEQVTARKDIDATSVQIQQTKAALEARRAALIRARKNIPDIQDRLIRLLGDAQINVLSKTEIVPASPMNAALLNIDAEEQINAAMYNNPILQQARLAVAVANINMYVAKRQRLPRLDLIVSAGLQGLGESATEADDKFATGNYGNYGVGLSFEYDLGNRMRLAEFHRSRLEHMQAVSVMQNIADQIAVQVKGRLTQVETTILEMNAQQAAAKAAKVQLEALENTEKIRGKLTPEFLLVKLQAQESLANARRAELQALVDYNNALAELALVTGTVLKQQNIQAALPIARDESDSSGTEKQPASSEPPMLPEED